jgi:tetratricopeptide (TPR) repeat protein
LFGFGPDVQASVFVRQYKIDWGYSEQLNSFPDRAHNAPLDILLQFGLFGAAAFFCLILFSVLPLWRRLRTAQGEEYWLCLALGASLISYGVNNLFSFSLTAMAVIFFWLLASAYVVGANFPGSKEQRISFFQPASRWIIAVGVLVLILIIFFGYSVRPFVADYYYMQVKKAEARKDCRATLDNMEKVMTWYPVSHYYARAYLHHSVNCFSAVSSPQSRQQLVNNIIDQVAVLPSRENQFHTLTDLAHAYSILGYYANEKYYATAEKYYHELLAINPVITVTYQDYGRMRLWQGRFAEAREIFGKGLAVTPSIEQAPDASHLPAIVRQTAYFHDLIGLSYVDEHDIDKAIAEYQKAIAIDPTMTSPYKELADIAYQRKDLALAIAYNKEGFSFEPENPLWPIGLATLYLEKKDFTNAIYYAKLGAQLDPTNEKIKDLLRELKIE